MFVRIFGYQWPLLVTFLYCISNEQQHNASSIYSCSSCSGLLTTLMAVESAIQQAFALRQLYDRCSNPSEMSRFKNCTLPAFHCVLARKCFFNSFFSPARNFFTLESSKQF